MGMLQTLSQALGNSFINAGRTRAREQLLARDDRFLADAGLSRELLESGNAAWPWRATPEREEIRIAVSELSRLDERELADLGIARGAIVSAVRDGRPGIDGPSDREAAEREAA